jgi:outer membrane protein W
VKTLVAVLCAASIASVADAQVRRAVAVPIPALSLRAFGVVTAERFTANDTFQAVFGQSIEPMWGGGLEMALKSGVFVDVAVTRLQRTGQRAFFFDGQSFRLGGTNAVHLTPVEVTAGYRFRPREQVIPYIGAGAGSYSYAENGDGTDPSEQFSARHSGYLVVGGAEFRVGRWGGVSADVQYTRVPGIIGTGGVSLDAGEKDLGGIAARMRVIVGR